MIDVSTDYEGLRQAALEVFAEARYPRARQHLEELREAAADDPEGQPGQPPEASRETGRKLASGYYQRVGYLLELQALVDIDQAGELAMSELLGLRSVAEARAEFAHEHPPCPHCDAPLETTFANKCFACGTAFDRSATGAGAQGMGH